MSFFEALFTEIAVGLFDASIFGKKKKKRRKHKMWWQF